MGNNYMIENTAERQTSVVQERTGKYKLRHKTETETELVVQESVGRKEGEMLCQERRKQQLQQEQESRNEQGTKGERDLLWEAIE